jgi:hypothetical protein
MTIKDCLILQKKILDITHIIPASSPGSSSIDIGVWGGILIGIAAVIGGIVAFLKLFVKGRAESD